MGFIDGDAAWYAQEMARRAANRAAQEAAREQARIDREQYEASSGASYGSWASGPAPELSPFRNLTMQELIRQRDGFIKELEEARRTLNGPGERSARDMIDLANYEIDRRNNFHTLSESERAALERKKAQQQCDKLRKERDELRAKLNDLRRHMKRESYNFEVSVLGWFSCFFDDIKWDIIYAKRRACNCTRAQPSDITEAERDKCPIEGLIFKAQQDYEELEQSFDVVCSKYQALIKEMILLASTDSSTDGQGSTASSS